MQRHFSLAASCIFLMIGNGVGTARKATKSHQCGPAKFLPGRSALSRNHAQQDLPDNANGVQRRIFPALQAFIERT
jgi:hypothetical protein